MIEAAVHSDFSRSYCYRVYEAAADVYWFE